MAFATWNILNCHNKNIEKLNENSSKSGLGYQKLEFDVISTKLNKKCLNKNCTAMNHSMENCVYLSLVSYVILLLEIIIT